MKLNRLRICQEASARLSQMKARTGLTPNILCRFAFCLSLNDPSVPDPDDFVPESDREIDRHTLTGPWDRLFVALIKERCHRDGLGLDDETLGMQFRAHVNRGVMLLNKRVRNIDDLAALMPGIAISPDATTGGDDHA
ncbi:MAG TPA: DNA sulfur modification protein DndE [Armatimonadota bacterium]|nr:DNA sulfur modification protein DndE [Armatimonadota bacterium]